jgi:retron-type reverse transcriptase
MPENLSYEELLARIPDAHKKMFIVDGKAQLCVDKVGARMLAEMSDKPKSFQRKFLKQLYKQGGAL